MADDINLPNLVSHLAVNLDGLQGTVADASRQGSSVGAALGGGIQRELQGLLAHLPDIPIDANSDELDRDLARVRRELEELGTQRIGIDIPVDQAIRRINELTPHLQRLSDTHPDINVQASTRAATRQLDELLTAARRVDDTDVDIDVDVDVDRPNRLAGSLGRIGSMAGSLGGVAATVGRMGATIGAAVPAAAGLVTTLANVAPAAGLAATGVIAVGTANAALKVGMIGVGDAISEAFSGDDPEKLAEALDKLSPKARNFVVALQGLKPQLDAIKTSVQDKLFDQLDTTLQRTAKATLPQFKAALGTSAETLNLMGRNVLNTATGLSESGALGKALGGATRGLRGFAAVPATIVQGLVQVGAAAAPTFERLSTDAGGVVERISQRLTSAFESGRMEQAIERAVDLIGELLEIGGNVADIIGGIFNAVPSGGGGMVAVLQDVTAAIAGVVNTADVQGGLRTLFETMGTIGATVAPLLAQALLAVAPVISALGPPVQTLVTSLGDALSPVISALGPVLQAVAVAAGQLITALAPLLTVFGQLITALLPVAQPLFEALGQVFAQLAPVLQQVADALLGALAPILAQMPGFVQPFANILVQLTQTLLPVIADLIVQLAPSLASLGAAFGQLMVAAAPILESFGKLAVLILQSLMPVIQPLIGLIAGLANILAGVLAGVINNVVVPVLKFLATLLSGDFSGAWNMAKDAVGRAAAWIGQQATNIGKWIAQAVATAVDWLKSLPGRAMSALSNLSSTLSGVVRTAGKAMVTAISGKIGEAVDWVKGLPGKASAALGDLGGRLASAGRSLINGFIDGIKSAIGGVKDTLTGLTNSLTDWKGPKKKDAKILTPAGRLLIEGFIKGIDGTTAKLRSRLESITKALPANVRSGLGKTLAKATAELEKLVTRRDAVAKRLATAQKKLDDLVKARSKAAGDITKGILDEANITTGRADVNSVSAITVGLQQALKSSKAFQANIAKLRKAGLRSDLLQQIADAGVEAGGATAAALAKATPAELKKINDLQDQLAKSATATGNTVGDALYTAGIRAAQGLVAGLKSQEKAIENQMKKIATNMLKTVKKKHKTKSPSRAFHEIGVMDMEGWRGGVLARAARVIGAARNVAGGVLDAASGVGGALSATPSAAQLSAVYAGNGGGGDRTYTINLYGADATPQGIVRELSWLGLVGRG